MILRAFALLCLALALIACREEEAAAPPPVRPVLSVVLQPQARGGQAFTGVIEPQFQAGLGFRLLGRVLARDVDVGDPVEKGQRLAAIDPVAQELAVRSARAELSNASAQLETATATELRQRRLMEQNVVSAADFEAAEQARDAASANVSRARANLSIAEEQLGYTQILADFDGVVTAVGADVGQVVSPGEPVVTIARPMSGRRSSTCPPSSAAWSAGPSLFPSEPRYGPLCARSQPWAATTHMAIGI